HPAQLRQTPRRRPGHRGRHARGRTRHRRLGELRHHLAGLSGRGALSAAAAHGRRLCAVRGGRDSVRAVRAAGFGRGRGRTVAVRRGYADTGAVGRAACRTGARPACADPFPGLGGRCRPRRSRSVTGLRLAGVRWPVRPPRQQRGAGGGHPGAVDTAGDRPGSAGGIAAGVVARPGGERGGAGGGIGAAVRDRGALGGGGGAEPAPAARGVAGAARSERVAQPRGAGASGGVPAAGRRAASDSNGARPVRAGDRRALHPHRSPQRGAGRAAAGAARRAERPVGGGASAGRGSGRAGRRDRGGGDAVRVSGGERGDHRRDRRPRLPVRAVRGRGAGGLRSGRPPGRRSAGAVAEPARARDRHRGAVVSGARWGGPGRSLLSAAVLALLVFGPLLAPYPATATVGPPFRPPGGAHLLGTDVVGRDVLSRVLHGGLPLLSVSIAALAAAYAIGLAVGLVAGLRAGADRWLMRPIDVLLVIPWFLLLAVVATALGAGAPAMVLTAGLAAAPWIARVVRTCVHELAATGYVEAARGRREPLWRIAVVEVLPNLRAVLAADAGIRSAGVISVVAVGGFLGLGLRPPSPDWALMITENRPGFGVQPWSVLAPALLVMLLVVPVNMLGDRALGSPSRVRRASGTRTGCSIDTGSADTDAVRVDGLTVRTDRGVPVLTDIAFRLPPGGGLAVVGPSGAGKTTLVSAVLGALPPGWTATGSVSIGVAGGGARRVGFVPQDPATGLNPALRIGAAIGEIARLRPRSPAERAPTVCAALRRVGLPDD